MEGPGLHHLNALIYLRVSESRQRTLDASPCDATEVHEEAHELPPVASTQAEPESNQVFRIPTGFQEILERE